MLTETTAELAASLSLAAARRIVEADEFMRAGLYDGWLPHLYDFFLLHIPFLFLAVKSNVKYHEHYYHHSVSFHTLNCK